MAKRLPVYIIIDTSGSMSGAPINAVNQAMATFNAALNSNPAIMAVTWVSIITFNETATQLFPLTAVEALKIPTLTADSITNYGSALSMLNDCLNKECVFVGTETQSADYRPLIFFFTDGEPTDDGQWEPVAAKLQQKNVTKGMHCFIAGCSKDAALKLKKISENVYLITDTSPKHMADLFKLMTNSINMTSTSMGIDPNAGQKLPPLPAGIVIC
jgi:uncharacterized protein YegL